MCTSWFRRPVGSARPRRAWAASIALVLALSATACSGDDKGDEGAPPDRQESAETTPGAPLVALPGKVAGTLPPAKRKQVARTVGKVVDGWFRAAYLDGPYPGADFKNAYRSFSPALRKRAAGDPLMSNAAIGKRIDQVVARKRLVLVDLLAPRGKIAGATVRFRLRFETSGTLERRFAVRGTLTLSRTAKGGFQIFGYDVDRASQPLPDQKADTTSKGAE